MTREMCTGLNISFSELQMMVAVLEYHKVCARWIPRMLTQKQKEQNLHVCQDVLNQYKTGGDSFLKYIISGEETWHHPY